MSSIVPTIGRKVWFWCGQEEYASAEVKDDVKAFDATVIFVQGGGTVNLAVIDHGGEYHVREDIELRDPSPDEDCHDWSAEYAYATWIPYQIGAAKKA